MTRINKIKNLARLGLALLIPVALFATAGCGRRQAEVPAEAPVGPSIPVVVRTVTRVDFNLKIGITGSTESLREVDFSARVGGTVASFPKLIGDEVAEGELIMLIDPRRYDAIVAQAEAGVKASEAILRNAERELERATELRSRDRISDAEFDGTALAHSQATSGLLSARAALTQAQLQREDCEIRAPFAGRITTRNVEVGELVGPGTPVTGIIDLDAILIRGSLSERDAVRVREGMEVDVRIPALEDRPFAGAVRSIGVRSDPVTRSFAIEVRVDNSAGLILSGMAARCGIHIADRLDVITVPVSAIVDQYGQAFVYVVEDGLALRRQVTLGDRTGDDYFVENGLIEGDRLIVTGQFSVRDSMAVNIKNPNDLD